MPNIGGDYLKRGLGQHADGEKEGWCFLRGGGVNTRMRTMNAKMDMLDCWPFFYCLF